MAIAERILRSDYGSELVDHRTWVIAGDGCMEEGVSHEAASLAGSLGLDHLTVFYDNNHITIDGPTELAFHDDTASRFAAYGWQVIDIGEKANDLDALEGAMRQAIAETSRPTLIVVRSHIGFPSPEMMDTREAHGNPFKPAVITEAKAILGVPDVAFHFDPALPGRMVETLSAQRDARLGWESRVVSAGATGVKLLEQLNTNGAATIATSPEPFAAGTKVATRKAIQRAMDCYAVQTPGLTAGSADLTDNTGMTLSALSVQSVSDPGGRQFHYGIREFAMSANLTGQAHHGGFRPLGSTFFVFSDYARPAIRLAALSDAGVMFVYTHDSVGVGEDGPTHEPVEQLMALRAMPELHVVRPSDANETLDLVEQFLTAPEPVTTAMILSRQDVAVFDDADARASKENARRGGYVVRENADAVFTLVGTGSEVAHCLSANDELATQGVVTRVVALPCWRCFDAQPSEYRDAVLRRTTPSVSLEAGATLGWTKYVDQAIGIDSFGMSAPGSYVMDYFKINAATLVAHVHEARGDAR
jgi:transketolase